MDRLAVALPLVLLAACGGKDEGEERRCNDGGSGSTLRGSYCEDVEMRYTDVKFLIVSDSLRIEYVRPVGTGSEKTLQIILNGTEVVLEPNVDIKLLDSGAQVRRVIAESPAPLTLTGEIESTSTLTFREYTGAIGSKVTGMFALLFKSGRTLSGDFEGVIEDARPM